MKARKDDQTRGAGKYQDKDASFLRRKQPEEVRAGNNQAGVGRDIYSDVVKNSLDDDAGGSRPGPIRYGTD